MFIFTRVSHSVAMSVCLCVCMSVIKVVIVNYGLTVRVLVFVDGPKRGRPTPGFSVFIRTDRATERPSDQATKRPSGGDLFVSLDQM